MDIDEFLSYTFLERYISFTARNVHICITTIHILHLYLEKNKIESKFTSILVFMDRTTFLQGRCGDLPCCNCL